MTLLLPLFPKSRARLFLSGWLSAQQTVSKTDSRRFDSCTPRHVPMKKPDEIALWNMLRKNDGLLARHAATALGIPEKRAIRILEKWCNNGWWDYGVNVLAGFFTPKAPETISP